MVHELASYTDGFAQQLGLTLTHADGDAVHGQIDVTAALHQPYDIVHGGVYCAVVETVASVGAALWFKGRGQVVGLANSTHFIRAVRVGVLQVEATPLQRGRTQQLWQVFITDEQGRLVSKGEVRLANITDPAALGRP